MNLPLDEIHDCLHGRGYLIIPLPIKEKSQRNIGQNKFKWFGLFKNGIRITDKYGFHNCTSTNVY